MGIGLCIDELRADPDSIARFPHAAFEHITDAELVRDLDDGHRLVLVGECRIAGYHRQPFDAGQPGDDLFHHAVGEILLFGVAAHVLEWQHGDRRPLGRADAGPTRVNSGPRHRVAWRLLANRADEADALPRRRADQTLLFAAVTDRRSGCIDAAGQGRFGYDPPGPDVRDQVILADDTCTVADQVLQEIEDLRLDGNRPAAATEFAPLTVERKILEQIQQLAVPPTPPARHISIRNQRNSKDKVRKRHSAAAGPRL